MNDKLAKLAEDIFENQLHFPQDMFEIAALLESMGWNDRRVAMEFDVADVFELAEEIWKYLQDGHLSLLDSHSNQKESKNHLVSGVKAFRIFLRGMIFAFPMAVSVVAMLNFKFSLWSYKYLALEQATSIAIGTIVSFVVVGGFTQAIARRGFFYIIQGYYRLAKKVTFHFIKLGFGLCVVISLLMVVLNLIFNMFSHQMILLIVVFFFFLTSIWLSVTVMYILKKELIFTGLIIAGIFFVYVMFVLLKMDILLSQVISLFVVSIVSLLLVFFYFMKAEQNEDENTALRLPKFSITLYSIWPYFLYGFLYFTFLFVDRVNAWSKNEEFMPYVIWFRGNYELGLDFALLTLIIPMGISEVIVTKLMGDIEISQKQYEVANSEKLYKKFVSTYWRQFGIILFCSLASAYLIYKIMVWYNGISIRTQGEDLLANEVTVFVLTWGIVSYVILSLCLMNAVILFALSQPNFMIKSIIPALLVNMLLGFLLSRWFEYEYAVLGLVVGSVIMAVLSTKYLFHVFRNLDYYLYSSS